MYRIIDGLLINSEKMRNIELIKGSSLSMNLDTNYSMLTITYPEGTHSSDISHPSISCIEDKELSTEGKFIIDRCKININGIDLYPTDDSLINISQYIIKVSDGDTQVYFEGGGIHIVINTNDLEMKADDYCKLLNESGVPVYAVVADASVFRVANFTGITFSRNRNFTFSNISPYDNSVIFNDETIILSGFIKFLREHYPQYIFKTRPVKQNNWEDGLVVSDKEYNNVIYYNNNLGLEYDKLNQRPLAHPLYETIRLATMPVQFEFVTDDTLTFMKFREEYIQQRIFSHLRDFTYTDPNEDTWSASSAWETQSDNILDKRNVTTEGGQSLMLHSFKFTCNVTGIICRRYREYPVILYKILNIKHN